MTMRLQKRELFMSICSILLTVQRLFFGLCPYMDSVEFQMFQDIVIGKAFLFTFLWLLIFYFNYKFSLELRITQIWKLITEMK